MPGPSAPVLRGSRPAAAGASSSLPEDVRAAIMTFVDSKADSPAAVARAVSSLRNGLSSQSPQGGLSALSGHFDLHIIPKLAQQLRAYLGRRSRRS